MHSFMAKINKMPDTIIPKESYMDMRDQRVNERFIMSDTFTLCRKM